MGSHARVRPVLLRSSQSRIAVLDMTKNMHVAFRRNTRHPGVMKVIPTCNITRVRNIGSRRGLETGERGYTRRFARSPIIQNPKAVGMQSTLDR